MTARHWLPAAAWLAVILTLTSIPNPDVPRVVPGGDKVVHLIMYGVLGLLVGRALGHGRRTAGRLVAAFAALVLLAAADEWHQRYIPGRSASVGDWVADSAGAAISLLLVGAHWRRRESR